MSILGRFWQRLKTAVEGEATTIEASFTDLEKKLLPGFSALVHKIEHTIGQQGLEILEQAMGDIASTIASGGNIGALIPAIISQVTADVKEAAKQDANTAAHGALELLVAALPVPAPAVDTAAKTE